VDPSNDKFPYPDALMLDVYDLHLSEYKFIPFDFYQFRKAASGIPMLVWIIWTKYC
jgi:hypothetical protein